MELGPCKFPNCCQKQVLAENEDYKLCYRHRNKFLDFCHFKINEPSIPMAVSLFIYLHPHGCSKREAGRGLGNRDFFMTGPGKNIGCHKDPKIRLHTLTQAGLIKGAKILYVWIGTCALARRAGLMPATVKRYALEGLLDEFQQAKNGNVTVKSEWLKRLSELKKLCKDQALKNSRQNLNNRPKVNDKISVQEIAKGGKVTEGAVYFWIKEFGLKAEKIGRYWYVDIAEFLVFLERVAFGGIVTKQKTRLKLTLIYRLLQNKKCNRTKRA